MVCTLPFSLSGNPYPSLILFHSSWSTQIVSHFVHFYQSPYHYQDLSTTPTWFHLPITSPLPGYTLHLYLGDTRDCRWYNVEQKNCGTQWVKQQMFMHCVNRTDAGSQLKHQPYTLAPQMLTDVLTPIAVCFSFCNYLHHHSPLLAPSAYHLPTSSGSIYHLPVFASLLPLIFTLSTHSVLIHGLDPNCWPSLYLHQSCLTHWA